MNMPDHYEIAGNYLDPDGAPIRATRHDADSPNAKAWVAKWIKACADVEIFGLAVDAFQWDHGRARHVLRPGEWVVWTGSEYRVVLDADFANYQPVTLNVPFREEGR